MNDMHGAIPKIKGGENQTITNKIVDIGLDRKQSKYDWPHEYQIHGGLISKPQMYGVPHKYPAYVEVVSRSPKYEVSQKYPTRAGLDTIPPTYDVLNINPTKDCYELPKRYPTPVELDTKPSKNNVPHRYPTPVRLDTIPPKYAVSHKYPTHVGLDTTSPKYAVSHKYPTHVGLDTKLPTYKVPHTYPTHFSTGISMQRNTADGHKPCADGYLIENRIHGLSEKTQYMVPTASLIGSHNDQDYSSNTEECALAELNKDHLTKMKPKRLSLTDSDTETKMNEILAMTNELNSFKLPGNDACIERTQSHKEKRLNDKVDTDFDKAISEILNSSDDENDNKQKSQFKDKRGRSIKRDITRRKTRRNSSDHDSSEPRRAKERNTQENESSILTHGNTTDEDIDDILKSTDTLVDIKRPSATDKRLQHSKRHMHECLQTEGEDVNKKRLTLQNGKKRSTILHIEPEEVRRRNRRKKLQVDMRSCTRELMMKTKLKESLPESHTQAIKEKDILNISPVKDRGYQQSENEDSPKNGIDPLINTLSRTTAVIQYDNKDSSVVPEKMRETSDDGSIVKKFAMKKKEPKTNSRSDTDIDINKKKRKKKKKRKGESQCFEKTNTLVFDIHVSTNDSETKKPERKHTRRVGKEKASIGGSNELNVNDTSDDGVVCKKVKDGIHLSKFRGNDEVSYGQDKKENIRLKRRSIKVVKEYKPAMRAKDEMFVERNPLFTKREDRSQVDLVDLMYDSSAYCSEDDYLSESPIPWIRCVSPEVEPRDLIVPMTDRQYDVVNDSDIVDGKVQVVELTHYDNTVLDNAEVEEGKTKNYGKIRKFFSRLFCCFKPKLKN